MIEVKERPKVRSGSMAAHIRKIGVIGAGQMAAALRMSAHSPVSTSSSTISRPTG